MPPRRPPVPSIAIPSSVGSTVAAERRQRRGHGLDPVGLLAPQLLGVADRRRPLGEAGGEGDQRQLVDRQRDLGAADLGGLQRAGADAQASPSARRRSRLPARPRSRAPIRSRIVSRPVRVGLTPTPSSSTSLSGTSSAATRKKAAEERSAGTSDDRQVRVARQAASTTAWCALAPRPMAPAAASIRSVWSRLGMRLDHPRLALGQQAGEEQTRLDLGAGDRHLVGDAVQRRAPNLERRQSALAAPSRRAHLAQRHRDPVDRPAADRVVAVERPLASILPCQPSRQQPQQGPGVADVDIRRPRTPQTDAPDSQLEAACACNPLPLTQPSSSTSAPRALHRVQGRAGVGGVEIALDRRLPLPHRRDQRRAVGDRLVRRRAQRAAQGSGGRKAVLFMRPTLRLGGRRGR